MVTATVTTNNWKKYDQYTPPGRADGIVTDVVHAKDNVSKRDRCKICTKSFKQTDAVIRVRNLVYFNGDPVIYHRRCMESLLEDSVDDVPKEKERFEEYRNGLLDRYGNGDSDGPGIEREDVEVDGQGGD